MTDSAVPSSPSLALSEIAEMAGGRLVGDPGLRVSGLAPVDEAGPEQLALLTAKRYTRFVATSRAAAFLVTRELERYLEDRPRVVVEEPSRPLVALLERLHPEIPEPAGIHPTAVLGRGVRLGADVGIGPYAVLGEDVEVGEGSRIGTHAVIGRGARVGRGCTIHPHVTLYPRTVLGDRVILHSGVRVGCDGFGYAFLDGAHRKIPHAGRVVLGSDVEIGANTTVDRGSVGETRIESGVKIDNLVQVAHNVHIGEHTLIAAMVGLSGSVRLGRGVWMGGKAGVIPHLEVGDGARVAVASRVMRDVPAGETVSGNPARPHREDLQRQAQVARLGKLLERVEALETELRALKASVGS